jgi:hypothetical protein
MTMVIDGSGGVTFPNSTIQASAGQILQVVNATYSTTITTTSGTYADTGLTATITPKFATSKIVVLVSQNGAGNNGTASIGINLQLNRGSTTLALLSSIGVFSSVAQYGQCYSSAYLDSPATTSATTYKTQWSKYNTGTAGSVYLQAGNEVSTITLMEIAA